jgi:surface antigen
MRNALRLMSILVIAGAGGTAHALGTPDWYALEGTAQDSLEYAKTDEPTPWVDPDSGTEGTFTPVATHDGPEGQVCREYSVEAIIDGREEIVYGTACRRPDGSWVEANAEYRESDPPAATSEVYSGTDWRWIIPNIAISGGYCSSSFCVGGQLGSYYPSWYYPWGISFNYWDYGRRGYYYPDYYRQHRYRNAGHYPNQHRSHYRGERRNHYGSRHKNERRGRHSERARSRDRRSDRDRSTDTRSRNRRSQDERSASSRSRSERRASNRSGDSRSGSERRASNRSRTNRSKSARVASNRSGDNRSGSERRASNQSRKSQSKSARVASNRSGGDRSRGRQSSAARSGGGRSGGKRGGRSSSRH